MENLEKRIDCEVTVAFRNKLFCKKCDTFPRPNTVIIRCAICENILCGNCSYYIAGIECPICESGPSIFRKEIELMEILSGFKTHPCTYVKNGCFEEIPAKLDKLTAHEQSCVFQKVPCPDCEGLVIFKDLGQHLKQHVNDSILVDSTEYAGMNLKIFGIYHLQAELINDRKYYKKDDYAISWNEKRCWSFTPDRYKGKFAAIRFAILEKDVQNIHNTTDWKLWEKDSWREKMLQVKGR